MVIIGVDPGARGALTLRIAGQIKDIKDMPFIEEKVGKTNRRRVNPSILAALLRDWVSQCASAPIHMYCEKVGPSSHDGVASAFAFGRAFGLVEMGASALHIPLTLVSPQEWHKGMSCSSDKEANRSRACQLYPAWAHVFSRKSDDGRAESALIAEYGERNMHSLMQ
jgi:crossover junction endodeoxyribonuclease RuvC